MTAFGSDGSIGVALAPVTGLLIQPGRERVGANRADSFRALWSVWLQANAVSRWAAARITRVCRSCIRLHQVGPAGRPAAIIPPGMKCRVEPAPVGYTADFGPVRSTTALANASGALEPHPPTDFRPIVGVLSSHLRPDRRRHRPLRNDGQGGPKTRERSAVFPRGLASLCEPQPGEGYGSREPRYPIALVSCTS